MWPRSTGPADEGTKRSLNQAFFKRLYVLPEWDEDHEQTTVQVAVLS